jgi:DNA-binding SARP family transcriptional activator
MAGVIVENLPYGIVVLDRTGRVVAFNPAAATMLDGIGGTGRTRCCDVFGCREPGGPLVECLAETAIGTEGPLPEIRIDLPGGPNPKAVWVTARRLNGEGSGALVHIRPGDPHDRRRRTEPHWMAEPRLSIFTLGYTRVESAEGPLTGDWLSQRAGQLLKYLLAERYRAVPLDEIAEALWPGSYMSAAKNVRHVVHSLRERLEPGGRERGSSSFIVNRHGAYAINSDSAVVDADQFEANVTAGSSALRRGDAALAGTLFEEALKLYQGDFLSDEPYAEWALGERERLRELAGEALQMLGDIKLGDEDLVGASACFERLAEMHPFDTDVQRELIAVTLRRGLRTQAVRRYAALRKRLLREFGDEPDFQLSDLLSA